VIATAHSRIVQSYRVNPVIKITPKLLCRLWMIPAIAIVLRCGPQPVSAFSYLLVAGYAFGGRRQAIVAFFLLFFFTLINHGLGPPFALAALLRWVVTLSAALSVLIHGPGSGSARGSGILLFTTGAIPVLIIVHSIAFSGLTDVSFLKGIAFGLSLFSLMAAWSWVTPTERQLTEIQVATGLMGMGLASIPLLFTSIGYMAGTRMFMGVFMHAQSLGPVMALLAVIVLATWLTGKKLTVWPIAILALCGAWVFLSQARIAAFAFVGGIGLASILYPVQRMAFIRSAERKIAFRRILLIIAACMASVAAAGTAFFEIADVFIKKGNKDAESLTETALASRGALIEMMNENIRAKPVTGIGFGVPSDEEDRGRITRDPVLGLAVSAPVEKGVMPVAVIEELGIPLASVVFLWMGYLGFRAACGGFLPLAVFLAAMLTNIAEATFFSPGAMGGLILILVAWAATSPDRLPAAGVIRTSASRNAAASSCPSPATV
jgi:hypothetical protein